MLIRHPESTGTVCCAKLTAAGALRRVVAPLAEVNFCGFMWVRVHGCEDVVS